MLGLYAAYLLTKDPDLEVSLLADVVEHLKQLFYLGPDRALGKFNVPHPDVQALEVFLAERAGQAPTTTPFSTRPSCGQAGTSFAGASVKAPSLVAEGCLLDLISGDLWGPSAFTIWKRNVAAPRHARRLEQSHVPSRSPNPL